MAIAYDAKKAQGVCALLTVLVQIIVTPPLPIVTAISPSSGVTGSTVTITGQNFGPTQDVSVLTFNGVVATATSWSDTTITATVPSTATTGSVVLTRGARASSGMLFTVTSGSATPFINTTFNCAAWTQNDWANSGTRPNCSDDIITPGCVFSGNPAGHCITQGGGNCVNGSWGSCATPDEITAAANNPNGGGQKGFRMYMNDGQNVNGGAFNLSFGGERTEYWLRWYERWQSGFTWSGGGGPQYVKQFYGDPVDGTNTYPRIAFGFYNGGFGGADIFFPAQGVPGTVSWSTVNGGATGDGLFHCYEFHIKKDTNGSNGIFQSWVGNTLAVDRSNVNFNGHGTNVINPDNQNNPANGGIRYRDIDDIAVATAAPSGRIGCTYGT